MKLLLAFSVYALLVGCYNKQQTEDLDLGKKLPPDVNYIDTSLHLVLIKPNEFKPGKLIAYKGVQYDVYLDSQGIVKFISTSDMKFKTPEGNLIGETYQQIKSKTNNEFYVPGFSYEVVLPSSWHAVFLDENILKSGKISDTSKIKTFFKRDKDL